MKENTVEMETRLQAQDDAVQDAASGEREDTEKEAYYRSQKEVDEAFAKRLSHEKQKWEKEMSLQAEVERLKAENNFQLPEADAEAKEKSPAGTTENSEFIRDILEQVEEYTRDYPEFDMEEAMENPLFAMMLANGESLRNVADYFYPDKAKERILREAENEVVERIRKRNARPRTMANANQGEIFRDIAKLSDEEILNIDRRVKRGERIVL